MTKEALKLALEALEGCEDVTADVLKAITAIREALAQPQRKPLSDEEVEKIIKSNMSLQMNLAGIRADFEAAHGIKGEA